MRSIQFRKPALVAEGTKQELSHELEAVLVHREAGSTTKRLEIAMEMA